MIYDIIASDKVWYQCWLGQSDATIIPVALSRAIFCNTLPIQERGGGMHKISGLSIVWKMH